MSDHYQILGIRRNADDAAVRAAYLAAVRDWPPERDAERFAAIRRAFEALATQRQRLANDLFDQQPPTLEGVLHHLQQPSAPIRANLATLLRVIQGSNDGR